ncbi:MAG TPA: hypothetical protein DCE44_24715 [Verrucomicrobiales bacterium]|nr:hypothetical protein [Verrucomicrobiales bacterium]
MAGPGLTILDRVDGTIVRQLPLPAMPTQPPVLTPDGVLLLVAANQLRAFRVSEGLDTDAPWPMNRRDLRGSSSRPGSVPPPEAPQVQPPTVFANKTRLVVEPWSRPTGYELWRSDSPDFVQATLLSRFPVGESRIEDGTAVPGHTYHYWIRAQNVGGFSAFVGPFATHSISVPRKWRTTGSGQTPPAVASDGTIFTTGAAGLTALQPDGSSKWSIPGLEGQPVVSADGTIYLRAPERLFSLTSLGTTNWSAENTALRQTAPALGADGLILIPGAGDQFVAYRADGSVAWQFADGYYATASPSVDTDGTVAFIAGNRDLVLRHADGSVLFTGQQSDSYFQTVSAPPWTADGKLLLQPEIPGWLQAINRDGTTAWTVESAVPTFSPPAVAADGTIFVRLSLADPPESLSVSWIVALNPDGRHRWKQRTDSLQGTPVLTADGLVLANGTNSIRAYRADDGILQWTLDTAGANSLLSPILDYDGTLLVASSGALEAFDLGVGPALAPWPMHRQNPRQSASKVRPEGPVSLGLKEVSAAEVVLSVTGPAPSVILLKSSDLRLWRREAVVPTEGGATNLGLPHSDAAKVFYRVVVP